MVSVCLRHFNFYKLLKSNLINTNILCLVRFGSGWNKLVQLLIWTRNIFAGTILTPLQATDSLDVTSSQDKSPNVLNPQV